MRVRLEVSAGRRGGMLCLWQMGPLPGAEPAVEHMHVTMAKELQKPEEPCRPFAAYGIVDDDAAVRVYSLGADQVLDDPQKGGQRVGARVDQADPKDIEAAGARDVTVGIELRLAQVKYDQAGFVQTVVKLVGRPYEMCVLVGHIAVPR